MITQSSDIVHDVVNVVEVGPTQITRWVTCLLCKPVIVECRIEVNESKKVTDGCEHTLADMIPKIRSDPCISRPASA